jgi:hypothetical protein
MKLVSFILVCFLSLPGFGQEDDSYTEEIEADRRNQNELALELDETQKQIQKSSYDAPEELRKLGYDSVGPSTLMDKKALAVIKKMLQESPLKEATPREVRILIQEKIKGKPFESFLNRPKVMITMVELLRDEKALPSAVGLFARHEDLKKYFYIWLAIIIGSWFFKKYWVKKKKKWSRSKIFLTSLFISLLAAATSLTIFYQMFYQELSPTTDILLKHWQNRNS